MIQAGRLRHFVQLQSKTLSGTGDRGQPVYTWTTYAYRVPAAITALAGRKLELARQICSSASHLVEIRYNEDFLITHRILFGSQILNVGDINNVDERNRRLLLTCMSQDSGAI